MQAARESPRLRDARCGEREARVGGPGLLRHGLYQVAVAGGGTRVIATRRSRELPLTWRGPGEGARTRPTARLPRGMAPGGGVEAARLRWLLRGLACGDRTR